MLTLSLLLSSLGKALRSLAMSCLPISVSSSQRSRPVVSRQPLASPRLQLQPAMCPDLLLQAKNGMWPFSCKPFPGPGVRQAGMASAAG